MNEQEVMPIASLEKRLAAWESTKKSLYKEYAGMAVLGYVIVSLLMYGFHHYMALPFGAEQLVSAALITGALMVPPIMLGRSRGDRKPTQADVDADVALRKSFGMDCSVE